MTHKRLLINGAAGRIGRAVTHEVADFIRDRLEEQNHLSLVALNDPAGIDTAVASYREKDPVHGVYDWRVEKVSDKAITLNGGGVNFYAERDITGILKDEKIDMVLECSGFYGNVKGKAKKDLMPEDNGARQFLDYGVERVIQTYPATTADAMLIMGVNHESYDPEKHQIISNASCTTKSLAGPLQALMNRWVGIEALTLDTVHAATTSQDVLPTLGSILSHGTGAAKATGIVIPSLEGKMDGMAWRVPTKDGSFSCLNFVASYRGHLTAEKVNGFLREAVEDSKSFGRLGVFEGKEIDTDDITGRRENAVVVPSKTIVFPLPGEVEGGKINHLVKLVSAYDNELGSSVDPVLLAQYVAANS